MRIYLIGGLFAAAVLAAAAPASAQTAPTQPSRPTSVPEGARIWREPPVQRQSLGQRWEYETFIDEATGNNINAPLERVDLANRVSGLIQLGRCSEARALANAEGDRQMALRARQLCRADRG